LRADVPAGLVAQAAPLGLVLAAAQDVPQKPLATEEGSLARRRLGTGGLGRGGALQAGFDQRPAAADPVAVAAVDELVGATGEAALGGVLARRKPRDEPWNIEVPDTAWEGQEGALILVKPPLGELASAGGRAPSSPGGREGGAEGGDAPGDGLIRGTEDG